MYGRFGESLRAAKGGDPQQMMMVSQMYLEGYGVQQSNEGVRVYLPVAGCMRTLTPARIA